MQKSKPEISTNNLILVAVLVSLLAVIAAVIIGRGLTNTLILNNKIISKKNDANEQLKQNLDNVSQLSENYNRLGNTSRAAMNALPEKPAFPASTSILEAIAGVSGVQLRSVSPSGDQAVETGGGAEAVGATDVAGAATAASEQSADGTAATDVPAESSEPTAPQPQEFAFSATVEGTYVNVIEFMRNLELSGRTFKVNALTLGGESRAITADIQLTSYWQEPASTELKTEPLK